jgi:septal ring factor EnvC (AmiA/AmiB activator)|tara:strand:- start:9702 stop:9938 length:237 start_codon:yes stop_codon:yes gene_type:complete
MAKLGVINLGLKYPQGDYQEEKMKSLRQRLKELENELKDLKKEVRQTAMDSSISDVVRSKKTKKILAFRNERPMKKIK